MAGESPDRSEQQKSSGETTQSGDRDPRLTVLQDRPEEGMESSSGESGLGDGASRPETAAAADPGEPAEKAGAGADGGEDSVDADSGEVVGSGDAGGDGEGSAEDAVADEGERRDAPESSSEHEESADSGMKRDDSPESGANSRDSAGDSSGGSSAHSRDDRLRDAVAAWVAGADAETDPETDSDTPQKATEPAQGEPALERTAAPATGLPKRRVNRSPAAGGTREDGSTGPAPETGTSEDAEADADPRPATDDAPSAEEEAAPQDAGEESAEGAGEQVVDQHTTVFRLPSRDGGKSSVVAADEGAGKEPRDGDAVPSDTSEDSAHSGDSGDSGASEEGGDSEGSDGGKHSAPARESSADEGEDEGEDEGKGEGKGGDAKPPVDQPTTVFKAVRPEARPAGDARESGRGDAPSGTTPSGSADKRVDQPTTAFRAVPPPTERKAASDTERNSKFVPLLSDEVAPRKPASAVGTAEAKPAVPPRPTTAPSLPKSERTKEQPLPPEPAPGELAPLDLLAQLTNTPPPPETPLRTVVRRIKIWTPLAVLLAIVFAIVQGVRPLPEPTLDLTASATYEFDGAKPSMAWPAEGQAAVGVDGLGSFGTSGEQKPVPIASVAKTMTAFVVLKDHPLKKGTQGATIPVDKKAEEDAQLGAQNESVVETKEGEKLTETEALHAIMIASANNVARLLARWDAGSEAAFVKKMNDAAKDLGMKNTRYTDPSGLEATTVSTAEDQVKLGRKVMQHPVFREIVAKPFYMDRNGKKQQNWNRLVPFDGVGIKTGTSSAAQGNLLFAAEKKVGGTTQLIVGAVLRQPADAVENSILKGAVDASKALITAAGDTLISRKVVKKGDVVGQVDDGLGNTTPVIATKDVSAVGWAGLSVDIALTDDGKAIPHEAKAGTTVGTMTVGNGLGQVKVPIKLQKDLVEPGFGDKLTRIL
ncbi:serine hydrolase [Streptomyces sp. KR80]|uniref:serine hydrolase n=1 Tax=Streptomyces sp. KR80 TaxID=3457426 RepID=UPI003FD38602